MAFVHRSKRITDHNAAHGTSSALGPGSYEGEVVHPGASSRPLRLSYAPFASSAERGLREERLDAGLPGQCCSTARCKRRGAKFTRKASGSLCTRFVACSQDPANTTRPTILASHKHQVSRPETKLKLHCGCIKAAVVDTVLVVHACLSACICFVFDLQPSALLSCRRFLVSVASRILGLRTLAPAASSAWT